MTYPNGVVTTYNYDSAGRLESIVHSKGGQTLKSFEYQFDDNGNITKITYQDGSYIDYTYDEWNRLTGEHKKNVGDQSLYQIQYSFDNTAGDTGNIYQKIVTRGGSPETTTFTYDAYNKLTNITYPDSSTETLTYDDNGQLITRNKSTGDTTTYEWNDQGFLKKVTLPDSEEVEYSYDGMSRLTGRKVKSSGGQTLSDDRFVQSGWDIVSDIDSNENRTYYTGASSINDRDFPVYYHYNHRGDTILVTDNEGNVLQDLYYEAYGIVISSLGDPISPPTFRDIPNLFVGGAGIGYDCETDLYYMRFRWFSPEFMRFISPDLMYESNRFQYVSGNPISFLDPFGLWQKPVVQVINGKINVWLVADLDGGKPIPGNTLKDLRNAGYKRAEPISAGANVYDITEDIREKWGERPFEALEMQLENENAVFPDNCTSMALSGWPNSKIQMLFEEYVEDRDKKALELMIKEATKVKDGMKKFGPSSNRDIAVKLSTEKMKFGDRLYLMDSTDPSYYHWTLPMVITDRSGNQWTFNMLGTITPAFVPLSEINGQIKLSNHRLTYPLIGGGDARSQYYKANRAILFRWCKWVKE